MSKDEFTLYDAAYVLGALSPVERRDFEDHLKGCSACSTSVGELAGLPGLMSKVSVEQLTAEVEGPPDTLLPALARAVGRERSRRRLAMGVAAVAAACVVAVGAVAISSGDAPAPPSVASPSASSSGSADLALSPVVPSPVTASARLVDMAWGTRIDLTCSYSPKGSAPAGGFPYALVVIDRGGVAQQVAAWTSLPGRQLTVMGASSLTRREIAAVEIRTLSGLAILRLAT